MPEFALGLSDSTELAEVSGRRLSLPAGRQGLTLHFDRLSVLSMPKGAALLYPAFKDVAFG